MTYYLCCMENLSVPSFDLSKPERYEQLSASLSALLTGETDFTANTANAAALIFHAFDFHWLGFYWVKGNELVLGAFQGPVACTRIAKGKGVCGKAWEQEEPIVVPNVNEFPGHIACSPISQSELVVPIKKQEKVIGVLDIDSAFLNDFDFDDVQGMQKLVDILRQHIS